MRTIRLYGALGKRFGKVHILDVQSVSEAIRALCVNYKEFREFVEQQKGLQGYEVWDGKYNIKGEDTEFSKLGESTIKIVPKIVGASAVGRIVTGVALIAAGILMGPAGWAGFLVGGANGMMVGLSGSSMIMMGGALLLGGISQLLSPKPTDNTATSVDQAASYIFSGATNTTKQGNPIAIGYGEMLVGSQVISASITTNDIPV